MATAAAARALVVLQVALACARPDARRADVADSVALPGFSLEARRVEGSVDSATAIPILIAVRTGRHEGFERVVFEFRHRTPGYRAEYLNGPPVACGSGDTVRVDGGRVFSISFSPADAHEFDGEQARSSIPERSLRPDLGGVRQMTLTCDFEAEVAWAIGIARAQPFRVSTFEDRRVIAVDFATTVGQLR